MYLNFNNTRTCILHVHVQVYTGAYPHVHVYVHLYIQGTCMIVVESIIVWDGTE